MLRIYLVLIDVGLGIRWDLLVMRAVEYMFNFLTTDFSIYNINCLYHWSKGSLEASNFVFWETTSPLLFL